MTLRQESLIEAFALNPELLSESETADVIALINESEEAEALHAWFGTFYEAFVSHQYVVSEKVHRFVERLCNRPDIVRLVPRRTVRRDSRTGQIAAPKLAAATRMHRAFELIGSSMATDGRTDVRFIRDVSAKRVRIYIVSEQEALYRNVLLLFEGSSVLLLTDESGHTSIDEGLFGQLGLIERTCLIRPMHSQFDVDPKDLGNELTAVGPSNASMRAQATHEKLRFEFDSGAIIAFGGVGPSPDWRHIQTGAHIDLTGSGPKAFTVRVYG